MPVTPFLTGNDFDPETRRVMGVSAISQHKDKLKAHLVRIALLARDVDEARQDVEDASISSKQASTRFTKLSAIDNDLLARSRGQIANFRARSQQKRGNGLHPYPVDRQTLERSLQQAERHVAMGKEHISRQRERIVHLERNGQEVPDARKLLALFEELQIIHVAHWSRLMRQLTAWPTA